MLLAHASFIELHCNLMERKYRKSRVPQHPKIGIDVFWTVSERSYHFNENFTKTEGRSTAASYCPQTRRWSLLWMFTKLGDKLGWTTSCYSPSWQHSRTTLAEYTLHEILYVFSLCSSNRGSTVAPLNTSPVVPPIGSCPPAPRQARPLLADIFSWSVNVTVIRKFRNASV